MRVSSANNSGSSIAAKCPPRGIVVQRRDVFEFTDGRQLSLADLPGGPIFDVLVVPGSEQLSAVLNTESSENDESKRETESLLDRFMAHF